MKSTSSLIRPLALFLLASGGWFPLFFAAEQETEDVTPDRLTELSTLVQEHECEKALSQIAALRRDHPRQPDLMTLEANCRLSMGRSTNHHFDGQRYLWLHLATGTETLPKQVMSSLETLQLHFEPEAKTRALELFTAALEEEPSRPDMLIGAIAAHLDTGEIDTGLSLLRAHAGSLDPDSAASLGEMVFDYLRTGRPTTASRLADAIVHSRPDLGDGFAAQALVALDQGRALDGIALLAKAREAGNRRPALRRELGRLQLLCRRWDDAVATLLPQASAHPEVEIQLALARSSRGDGSALPIWESVARKNAAKEKPDERISTLVKHYKRLLGGRGPAPAPMRLRGARYLEQKGLPLAAVVEAGSAVTADPSLVEGWLFLGNAYRRNMFFDAAVEALDKGRAAARTLGDASPYQPEELALGQVQALIGLQRFEEALELATRISKKGQPAQYEAGVAALALGRKEEAERLFKAVVEGQGENADDAAARLRELGVSPPAPAGASKADQTSADSWSNS